MTTIETRTLPPPTGISEITAHLVAGHDWPANTPINGEHAQAHDFLHGVGRSDLVDKTLSHRHLAPTKRPLAVAPAGPSSWRDDYMPAILVGVAISAIGLVLPWFTATAVFLGQVSRTGFDTPDGKVVAVVLVLLGLIARGDLKRHTTGRCAAMLIGGLIVVGVVFVDYRDAADRLAAVNGTGYGHADIAIGLYLSGLGGLISLVGAWNRLRAS